MLKPGKRHGLAILIVAAVCLSLAGCSESKVTKANFDRITTDMSEDEVERILGKGSEQAELNMPNLGVNAPNLGGGVGRGMKVKSWQEGSKTITITFRNDKVASKISNGL